MQKVFIDQINDLTPDLRLITHESNYACLGEQRTYANFGDNIVLDEKDYSEFIRDAIQHASQINVKRIVVIGFLTQSIIEQLERVRDKFEIVTVDIGSCKIDYTDKENIKSSRSRLSYFPECEFLYESLASELSTFFIVFESIENLYYPGPFVKLLRKLVRQNKTNRILLATNQRDLDNKGNYEFDYRVREWRELEIAHYMISMGFTIENLFVVQKNNERNIVCLVLHASDYQNFLEKHFSVSDTDSVLVTSFFDGIDDANNLDVYFRHIAVSMKNIYSLFEKKPIVIYFPRLVEISEQNKNLDNNFITPWRFFDDKHIESFLNYDQRTGRFLIYHLFYQIYLFFDIKFIHTHDYDGMIYRIQDAITSNIFSKTIKTVIYTFAVRMRKSHYNETILPYEEIFDLDYEREVLERSDLIVLDNKKIIDIYDEVLGIKIDKEKTIIQQFAFSFFENSSSKNEHNDSTSVYDLLFIGEPDLYHGFDKFIKLLEHLANSVEQEKLEHLSNQVRIYFIKPCVDISPDYRYRLDNLSNKFNIQILEIDSNEIEKIISENSCKSIAILPYSDNLYLKYLIFNLIKNRLPFVTCKEVLPNDVHEILKYYVFLSNKNDLNEYIGCLKYLLNDYDRIIAYFSQISQVLLKYTTKVNNLFLDSIFNTLSKYHENKHIILNEIFQQKVSVVISVYKIELKYVEELCQSINYQSVKPFEVIFVDDGSGDDYHEELIKVISKSLKVPYNIVYQENKGQAAAVNHGIRLSSGDFVLCIDADDVMVYNMVERYLLYLLINDQFSIVVGYPIIFDEKDDSNVYLSYRYPHYSFSHQIKPVFFIFNYLGGFYFMFRRDLVEKYTYLEDIDNYKYADYAFFIRLIIMGVKRGLLLEPVLGYRQRINSRSNTVSAYTGKLRIMRNFTIFNKFEAYAFMTMTMRAESTRYLSASLHEKINELTHNLEQIKREKLDLLNQIHLLRDKTELLERDLENKKFENADLLNRVDQLNKQIENFQYELSTIHQNLEIERTASSNLRAELIHIKNTYDTTVNLLSVKIALKLSRFVSENMVLRNMCEFIQKVLVFIKSKR